MKVPWRDLIELAVSPEAWGAALIVGAMALAALGFAAVAGSLFAKLVWRAIGNIWGFEG